MPAMQHGAERKEPKFYHLSTHVNLARLAINFEDSAFLIVYGWRDALLVHMGSGSGDCGVFLCFASPGISIAWWWVAIHCPVLNRIELGI